MTPLDQNEDLLSRLVRMAEFAPTDQAVIIDLAIAEIEYLRFVRADLDAQLEESRQYAQHLRREIETLRIANDSLETQLRETDEYQQREAAPSQEPGELLADKDAEIGLRSLYQQKAKTEIEHLKIELRESQWLTKRAVEELAEVKELLAACRMSRDQEVESLRNRLRQRHREFRPDIGE
jgi:chromosome segregation ATPase